MKYIKIIIVIFICFVLTGCTFKYDLEIYNDEYIEDGNIPINNSEIYDDNIFLSIERKAGKYMFNTDPLITQKRKVYKKDDYSGAILTNKYYSIDDYRGNSFALKMCYDSFNVTEANDLIHIFSSEGFKCFDTYDELDEVVIHIKSNHKMESTNADEVDGYNYYWYINKENSNVSQIQINLYKDKYVFNYNNIVTKIIIGIGILAFLAFIVIIIFRKKASNTNKI